MKIRYLLPLLILLPGLTFAAPASEAQLAAIARMGELNGIALECRFVDQVRRIKQELIARLPKQRELGAWFEEKTNASFTAFMSEGRPCPALSDFEKDLDAAVQQLDEAFPR